MSVALVLVLAASVLAGGSGTDRLEELNAQIRGGKYAEAERGARARLADVEAASGADSVEAAGVLDVLVESLWRGGKAGEPESRTLAERAVGIKERAFGPDHPEVARSLNNLACLLRATGDYAGARPLFERALAIAEQALGADHLDVANNLNGLASVLQATGNYAAARPLFERALAIREKVLGPDHPHVAVSLNNLAVLSQATGDYAGARPLFERALAIREKALGPDHPDVAKSLNNLANVLAVTGDYAAARPLFERALAILEPALGPGHPTVAAVLNGLAGVLGATGEYAAARPLYERALAILQQAVGPDHPQVAESMNDLANLLSDAGDYAAARPLLERALAIREKALGPDHPDVARSLNNLAVLLSNIGDFTGARPLYERALAIWDVSLGPDHPDVASGLINLADALSGIGDFTGARPLCERGLAIREKALGPDHPLVAKSLNSLAGLLSNTGDYAAARALDERALAILERALGPDHPDVANGLIHLARPLLATGDDAAARPLLERALAIEERALGPDHPDVANGLLYLASVLWATGDGTAARPLLERALAIEERALGHDHPLVAMQLANLALLDATHEQAGAAVEHALDAERIAREHLRLTSRSLSERQALRYASARSSGLDVVLTLAGRGLDRASRRRVLDALIRSRAVVLDEMAARHRTIGGAANAEVARLAEALASARTRLANLVVRGPGQQKAEIHRTLLEAAREEKEQAERALAGASAAFARELSRGRLGLDDVAASLPPSSALVAFTQYTRIDLASKSCAMVPRDVRREAGGIRSYLAFVLRSGERDPSVVDLGTAQEIDALVGQWKKEAAGGAPSAGRSPEQAEVAYSEAGTPLRRSIWDPVARLLSDVARVFVVPDGSLNLVNVAALPAEDGGYLIEHGPLVHYLSAERDLVPAGDVRRGEGLLALGGPAYDATSLFASLRHAQGHAEAPRGQPSGSVFRGQRSACGDFASVRFEPLPATSKETGEIVRLWQKYGTDGPPRGSASSGNAPGSTVLDLREAAASETALKRSAPGRRVVHLATHGFFLGGVCQSALDSARGIGGLAERPTEKQGPTPPPLAGENPLLLSGLALAGANHRSAALDGEDDGILTAEEIASLDLSGVDWAVLSACETGVGDVRAGEGVFGLRRAFQVAGAGALIISLWSVEDEPTRAWMKALYQGRLESHLDTVEAVRAASLTVMDQRRKAGRSTHPFYWGAFVAAGDWR